MKKLKISIVCAIAMLLGVGGAYASKTASHKGIANGSNYYVNLNNVSAPARTDLFTVMSDPSLKCDESSNQICAVVSTSAPDGSGHPPVGATYTAIADGEYTP